MYNYTTKELSESCKYKGRTYAFYLNRSECFGLEPVTERQYNDIQV